MNDSLCAYDIDGNEMASFGLQRTGFSSKLIQSNIIPDGKVVVQSLKHSRHNSEFYLFDQNDSLVFHEVYEGNFPVVEEVRTESGVYLLPGGWDGTVRIIRKS